MKKKLTIFIYPKQFTGQSEFSKLQTGCGKKKPVRQGCMLSLNRSDWKMGVDCEDRNKRFLRLHQHQTACYPMFQISPNSITNCQKRKEKQQHEDLTFFKAEGICGRRICLLSADIVLFDHSNHHCSNSFKKYVQQP